MFVVCSWNLVEVCLELAVEVVLNLNCFWTLPECSVLVRCSGSPVVDLPQWVVGHCWFGRYLLKGLNPSAQHVGFGGYP